MKKRYYVLLMMLVLCLWICGTTISVCAEEQVNTEPTDMLIAFDTLLSEFMNEDNEDGVSSSFVTKDCEIALAYDNGMTTIYCDSVTAMMESYGVEAKVYYFEDPQITSSSVYTRGDSYLYFDIVFQDKAKLGNDDKLWITLPDGVGLSHTEVKGRWAQPNSENEWIAVNDFVIPVHSDMTNHVSVPLNQIAPRENDNRLLLSFHATPTGESVTGVQTMKMTWRNNPVNNVVSHDAVVAPGFENTNSLWKMILLAVVLILDVIVAIVVYLKLKHRPKKTDEPPAQTNELSEEETVVVKEKLQSNLRMNNDDMEYLKSIGYFDSKSSKGNDV